MTKRSIRMHAALVAALFIAGPSQLLARDPDAAPPKADEVLDSVRFMERPDGKAELQTAVVPFTHTDGTQVDLVSVVHIGDDDYFQSMNRVLSGYDVVLYELVGGPMETRQERDARQEIGVTHLLQRVVQSMLGLRYQLDAIDYDRANFVHADATWEDWETLMEARNQSMATLFTRAFELQSDPETLKQLEEMGSEETMAKLMTAVTEFNPDNFKRTLAPLLSESEHFIMALEGDDGTVIITERNKIVMERLEAERAKGHKKIGVFYGAGHMPDFRNRLLADGFKEGEKTWMPAWKIGNSATTISGLDLVENVLKDDQVIEAVISIFRTFAEQ